MKRFIIILIAAVGTLSAAAQVTTSSINGLVTAGEEEAIGATVTAVHEPSGVRYNAVTNTKGRYSIQGMRVGGPYTVTISYLGFKDDVKKNIQLALGENTVINADLIEDAQLLQEVEIAGQAGINGLGAASNFSQDQIEMAPTVDRNVYDVAKLSPLVNDNKFGGISIAGTNNRYNSFQIDGVVSNDVFGLASSGTNGGQTGANPISMDAIEQIQVVASPFDVRQSGFTGGAINAITKSGTNTWKGSAYGYYTNEDMYGKWSQLYDREEKLTDETTKTFGATLGGPIIKDKLFFFASFEHKKNEYPASYYAGADGYFLTEAAAQAILDRYNQVTGLTDSYGRRNVDTQATSVLARLDWNINDRNKFSLRYQLNDSYKDVYSPSTYTYYFNNSGYRMINKSHSFVAELNSYLGEKWYNELRASYTRVRDNRDIPYQGPTIYIRSAGVYDPVTGTETEGSNSINLGTQYSSGVNRLDQDIWTFEDNLSYYTGNHAITFGTHNEIYNMKNGFIQYAFGEYVYTGITGFLNDETSSFLWNYSDEAITGTTRWLTPFKAGQLGFYVQDKWDASTRLQLTFGLRTDIPIYLNAPTTNVEFNSTKYSTKYNAVVGRKPESYFMLSPRLGFRWYADEKHNTLLRGGVGIFNGRAPFVWIENAWANTGVEMKGVTIYSPNAPSFMEYGADAAAAAASAKGTATKPAINTVNRDFKFPQVLRGNLALEQNLPGNARLTLEGLISKNFNDVWFENLALIDNGMRVYAVNSNYPNSATTYYSTETGSYASIVNMTNVSKAWSYSLSAKIEKKFNFGLDIMASYTFGHSYSVNDGTSSVALSNWGYYYCVDPNKADLTYSMYDKPHRVLAVVSYNSKRYFGGLMQSHVSLTYNGISGQRYSLVMSDKQNASFNGDYRTGNTLLYIPTIEEIDQMNFKSEDDRVNYENWIEGDSYAKNHRGQYAKRNSNLAPWENHFDFHFSQDFYYLKKRGSKISLVLDIINFSNLINKKWGTYYSSAYAQNILQVVSTSKGSDGHMVGTYSFQGNKPSINDFYSRWHGQVGLRVTF